LEGEDVVEEAGYGKRTYSSGNWGVGENFVRDAFNVYISYWFAINMSISYINNNLIFVGSNS
jgi:hypothetical protein